MVKDTRSPEHMKKMNSKYGMNLQPHTERYEKIKEALKILLDPDIPYEHIKGNHNCGECWLCIYGTITLTDIFIKENRKHGR